MQHAFKGEFTNDHRIRSGRRISMDSVQINILIVGKSNIDLKWHLNHHECGQRSLELSRKKIIFFKTKSQHATFGHWYQLDWIHSILKLIFMQKSIWFIAHKHHLFFQCVKLDQFLIVNELTHQQFGKIQRQKTKQI